MSIDIVCSSLYSFLLSCLSVFYLYKYSMGKRKNGEIKRSRVVIFCFVTFLMLVAISILNGLVLSKKNEISLYDILLFNTLMWGVYVVSVTDLLERKITTLILLIMLGLRFVGIVYCIFAYPDDWNKILWQPLLGAGIAIATIIIPMLLSRKSTGMGDLKLLFVVGLFVGGLEILPVLLYSYLLSAIVGLYMLFVLKKKLNDTLPMAPFVLFGVIVEYVFYLIGGLS